MDVEFTRVLGAVQRNGGHTVEASIEVQGVLEREGQDTLFLGVDSGKSGFAATRTQYHSGRVGARMLMWQGSDLWGSHVGSMGWSQLAHINVTTLDKYVASRPEVVPVDWVKIDVEVQAMWVLLEVH